MCAVSHASDPQLLVLHALRLKRYAEPGEIAERYSLDESMVSSLLLEASSAGQVRHRSGRIGGFHLTDKGAGVTATAIADELEQAGVRDAVAVAHQQFLGVNLSLLEVCTAWQLCESNGTVAPNDHVDAAYDASVIRRLSDIHDTICPVLDDLTASLGRFGLYQPRLSNALDQVRAGDVDYFTKPMFPSYHSVWFELHEDLLATLGIDRADEAELRQ